jgi:hypothetical protein
VLVRLLDHPALQGPEHVAHLRSVYFETPACDLGLSGLSLRVRDTGEGYIQTVKQRDGAGGFTRGEWEVKVPAEALDLTALSKTLVEKVLKGKLRGLEPVSEQDTPGRLTEPFVIGCENQLARSQIEVAPRLASSLFMMPHD